MPANLAVITAELASSLRSAFERTGLSLTIECAQLPPPVRVDRDIWEKAILNLRSSGFKFTYEGGIGQRVGGPLRVVAQHAVERGQRGVGPGGLNRVEQSLRAFSALSISPPTGRVMPSTLR